jgi:hypothetical protein
MDQEKKLAVPSEIPQAKKKARGSADEAKRKRGGKLSMVLGKSTLPEITFPIVGIDAPAGGLETPKRSKTDNQYTGRNVKQKGDCRLSISS